MSIELLRSLVWMDYRLAVLFLVLIPLGLLLWAVIKRAHALTHLLIIYWRVASLLAIAVYLLIAENPLGFLAGWAALVLIPISLWFWVDLNEEIADRRGTLKLAFSGWRWAATLYCSLSALGQLSYLSCGFSRAAIATPTCQVWLEAPFGFKQIFHPNATVGSLGFLALMALIIYGLSFLYFLCFRLSKQGRSATGF